MTDDRMQISIYKPKAGVLTHHAMPDHSLWIKTSSSNNLSGGYKKKKSEKKKRP